NIVGLSRSQIVHYDPSPNTPLFPGDRLYLFGEASQMAEAAALLEATADPNDESKPNAGATFNVQKLLVGHGSPLVGETLAGAELRKRHGISVLGIQRGDRKITAPPPEELMEIGDVLLVMGDPKAIERLQTSSLATN
ncbi:MAG: TrkA C-terminal domain-containing protein, partial [Verrucomicrobiota bacterium]